MVSADILTGDCRAILPTLPAGSAQCCVTSPPYWGLRDYGTAQWEGGDAGCGHAQGTNKHRGTNNRPGLEAQTYQYVHTCGKCGARRIDSQIGLEPTPEAYVAELVGVFREVRRVLANDGCLFVNLGDSYVASCAAGDKQFGNPEFNVNRPSRALTKTPARARNGLPPKSLVGIPWRTAFALQADGWILRQDIIWHKPNPMPESVTDRCTKAHEYLFLLVKQGRYYWDQGAMMEEAEREPHPRRGVWTDEQTAGPMNRGGASQYDAKEQARVWATNGTRNRRSVWTVATQPYAEAHFATFPPDLIRPCILATSRPGDTVLDPFGGSGTTGQVAVEYGRNAVLIELNEDYARLGERRTHTTPGLGI